MKETEFNSLSENEKLVLEMLKYDFDEKEIAEKLGISLHTVSSHKNKLEKLKMI